MKADSYKSHIGIVLDLNKNTDIKVDQILNNLPSYETKTAFIKKAIISYANKDEKSSDNNSKITELLSRLDNSINSLSLALSDNQDKHKKTNTRKNNIKEKKESVMPIPEPESEDEIDLNDIFISEKASGNSLSSSSLNIINNWGN